jgi:hypothetical protein
MKQITQMQISKRIQESQTKQKTHKNGNSAYAEGITKLAHRHYDNSKYTAWKDSGGFDI